MHLGVTSTIQTKQAFSTLEMLFSDSRELYNSVLHVLRMKVSSKCLKMSSHYMDNCETAAPHRQLCGSEVELVTAIRPPGMLTQACSESDSPQHSG